MSERYIEVQPMGIEHRVPVGNDPHVKTLSAMLKIASIDKKGDRFSRERRKLVLGLPAQLGAYKIDDFLSDDPTATRYHAAELLLTESIESTSLLNEEVLRTVVAGAEKYKVVRDCGAARYDTKSNSLRVPLGEAQINAPKIGEGAAIPDRSQEYGSRTISIDKYGMKPRISYEMVEDGLIDSVAEEIFFAGAAVENRLNVESLMNLATNAGNKNTTYVAASTSATAGNSLFYLKGTKKMLKADGFVADTVIMCSEMEGDLMDNANIVQAHQFGNNSVITGGQLPPKLLGMNTYVTDNGHTTTAANWEYNSDGDVAAIVMEARRGLGIAMRRDRTVKKFDDIEKELNTITVTMRAGVSYLHANAVGTVTYQSA